MCVYVCMCACVCIWKLVCGLFLQVIFQCLGVSRPNDCTMFVMNLAEVTVLP